MRTVSSRGSANRGGDERKMRSKGKKVFVMLVFLMIKDQCGLIIGFRDNITLIQRFYKSKILTKEVLSVADT